MAIHTIIRLLLVLLIASCTTTKYVEVEKTRDVYHHTTDTIRDSVYHDVFRNVYIKGDTVYCDKTEYLYKWKYINKTDTLIRVDSIPVIKEVEKRVEVEKPLSWWQKVLMWCGGISIALIGVGLYMRFR